MNSHLRTATPPIRVLLIVDSLYWVIGNFAHQVAKNNTSIEATTCSQFAIRKTVKRFGPLPSCFDLVHFLRTKTMQGYWDSFPVVTTLHHMDPKTDLQPFQKSDGVMTVSSQWNRHLSQLGIPNNHLGLVPFGVNINQFRPTDKEGRWKIRKTLHLSKDAFVLGVSSRRFSNIDDSKGITCFLQALKMLHQELPNLAILIIGPGWQTLAKNIRQEGILCAQAPYEMTHEHVAKYYQAMDLFWVTSRIEGGPVPLLEAMASGLPCVSTPVGAALDLINDDQNGFLVSTDSPDQFVKRSVQLAQSSELRHRIGKEARKTIVQERQWRQTQIKLQELYLLAIANFHTRTNQIQTQMEIDKKMERGHQMTTEQIPMSSEVFFSTKVQTWIQACERINGLQMMAGMKEWKAASRFGFQALCICPFDLGLWKEIILILLRLRRSFASQSSFNESRPLLTTKQPL